MRIYELRPIDGNLAHGDWKLSNYCGPCRVVAADEHAARDYAAREFANNGPRGFSTSSPWQSPELVTATLVIASAHAIPPIGTVMMPSKGFPGFSLGPRARRRMRDEDEV